MKKPFLLRPAAHLLPPQSVILCLWLAWSLFINNTQAQVQRAQDAPRYGGNFTETTLGDPHTLNLWTATDSSSSNVVAPLFEPLLARNSRTLKWEARLAELPSISTDGLVWTLRLREGLQWSDGQPLTADDVIFTLNVLYDPKTETIWRDQMLLDVWNPTTKKREPKPIAYRKRDERTVEFRFPFRYAPARELLSFPIAPRHKLEAAWQAGAFNRAWGITTPVAELVSSGPWIMESY